MNLNPYWIVGFTDGEGCFHIGIPKKNSKFSGDQVLPEFVVVQHVRNVQILHKLKSYFNCGVVRTNHGDRMAYRVRDRKHLMEIIIPFFEKYELCTRKKVDFLKFRRVMLLMAKNEHLTEEGLRKIRDLRESPAFLET